MIQSKSKSKSKSKWWKDRRLTFRVSPYNRTTMSLVVEAMMGETKVGDIASVGTYRKGKFGPGRTLAQAKSLCELIAKNMSAMEQVKDREAIEDMRPYPYHQPASVESGSFHKLPDLEPIGEMNVGEGPVDLYFHGNPLRRERDGARTAVPAVIDITDDGCRAFIFRYDLSPDAAIACAAGLAASQWLTEITGSGISVMGPQVQVGNSVVSVLLDDGRGPQRSSKMNPACNYDRSANRVFIRPGTLAEVILRTVEAVNQAWKNWQHNASRDALMWLGRVPVVDPEIGDARQ